MAFYSIAPGPDGKRYCPLYNQDFVLVIDPEATSCTRVGTRPVDPENKHKWLCVAQDSADGILYAMGEGPVLVIDTAAPNELQLLPCPEGACP